jgi:hypothetical protein
LRIICVTVCISIDWTALGAVASAAYTAAFVISIFVLLNQVKASRDAHWGQGFVAAVALHDAPEAVRARETVRKARAEPAATRFNGLVEDVRGNPISTRADDARIVCRVYQTLGVMIRRRMLPPDVFTGLWGREIEEQWQILCEFVMAERMRLGDSSLWFDFQALAALVRLEARGEARLKQQ